LNYKEFEDLLTKIGLNKKEFANITELSYQTVMNWNNIDSVPRWVKSWIENYSAKKKFENIKEILKDEI